MKKIIAGIVILLWLCFLQLGNVGFATTEPLAPLPSKPIPPVVSQNAKSQEEIAKKIICKTKCSTAGNDTKFCDCKCDWGIVLNTDFPFIGRCISKWWELGDGSSSISAIAQAFTNIFMTLIITWGFAMVIRWWVLMSMGGKDFEKWRTYIMNVVIAFAALGSLGIILRLINPNFFK